MDVVNAGLIFPTEAPSVGVKSSGLVREGTRHRLYDYLQVKYTCLGGIKAEG